MPRDGTLKVKVSDDSHTVSAPAPPTEGGPVVDPVPALGVEQLVSPAGRSVRWVKCCYARPGVALVVWNYGNDIGYNGGIAACAVRPNVDGTKTVGPVVDFAVPSGVSFGWIGDLTCAVRAADGVVAVAVKHDSMSILWLSVAADLTVTELRRTPPSTPQASGGNRDMVLASNGAGTVWSCGKDKNSFIYHRVSTTAADGAYQSWTKPGVATAPPEDAAFATGTSTVVWWEGGLSARFGTVAVSGLSATPGSDVACPAPLRYRHSAMIPGAAAGTVDLLCVQDSTTDYLSVVAGITTGLVFPEDYPAAYWFRSNPGSLENTAERDYTWLSRVAAGTYLCGYEKGGALWVEAVWRDGNNDWQWDEQVTASWRDTGGLGAHVGGGLFVVAYTDYSSARVAVR